MADPRVSVVLPVFNAESTLAACIESLLAQTFSDFEILIFDDGSKDGSARIAHEFARKDPRIQFVQSDHVGIVEALRQSCAQTRGEYLARMDADDVCHPDRLRRQVDFMQADHAIGLCGTQVRIVRAAASSGLHRYEEWQNGLVSHDQMMLERFVECPIAHPTFMMRRKAYECCGGYRDAGWAEDYDLLMRFLEYGYHLAKVPEVLIEWRHSSERLSMTAERYSPLRFRDLKRHFLFRGPLANGQVFHQWGAGEVGKPWLREWGSARPQAVVDINPGKIGKEIHGYRVIAPDSLPGPQETFSVVTVGTLGARDEIREWFSEHGYRELRDYVFLA